MVDEIIFYLWKICNPVNAARNRLGRGKIRGTFDGFFLNLYSVFDRGEEASSFSASQEYCHISWIPNVQYHVYKSPPLVPKAKGKFRPRTSHKGPEAEYRYSSTLSLTSMLDGLRG